MGTFSVGIKVGNVNGGDSEPVPEVMVDTGAVYTVLPTSLLEWLHVEPRWEATCEFADDRIEKRRAGEVRIEIDGFDGWRACVVVFGTEKSYLLGATTLENFHLMVDPVGQRLLPSDHRIRLL